VSNGQGFNSDVIELQLAHAEQDEVRGAYNRAMRMAEREAMMQAWADYLDGLRAGGATVVHIGAGRKSSSWSQLSRLLFIVAYHFVESVYGH